jgi:hypothetical protein
MLKPQQDETSRFHDLLAGVPRTDAADLLDLHADYSPTPEPTERRKSKSEWNPDHLPRWSPVLQAQFFVWMLVTPQQIMALHESEYDRIEMNKTGTWLAGTLIAIPALLLAVGLSLNVGIVDPLSASGIFCLASLSVSLGFAASVAGLSDRPFMAFAAFMTGFFGGVVTGMAAALLVERLVTTAYRLGRTTLWGWLLLVLWIASQIAGFVLAVNA